MTNVIVAIFNEEKKAMEAFKKLNELESIGDISLYDKVIVKKTSDGTYEALKGDGSEGWRAVGGMLLGGLVGAIGGPIGIAIGLYAGTVLGVMSEVNHYDFATDFIEEIERKVVTGTYSIFAEIDEEDADIVQLSLQPLGAIIWKSNVDYTYDEYMIEQMEDVEDEIAEQRHHLKNSIGKEKEKIENEINTLKEKRKAMMTAFDTKLKKAANDVKDSATTAITNTKEEVIKMGKQVEASVDDAKTNRLKRSIARHEAKLSSLKEELEVLA